MNEHDKVTAEWQSYETGRDYNQKLNLYSTVDKNERFYAGDQWHGVQANGLPTPVFNIFKRIINYFIAAILSQKVTMKFTIDNVEDETQDANEQELQKTADMISKHSEVKWEKCKMDTLLRDGLLDAALSGDLFTYTYWDKSIKTGQKYGTGEIQGDFVTELVDNVNVMFGNPNATNVQKQPYILIIGREMVYKLKEEAKANGVPKEEIDKITADTDTNLQSGDRGKIELDNNDENGKCLYLIKLWKDKGNVWYRKSTKYVTITKDVDMGLKLYPVAFMNWDKRKNSYHGQAIGTGLIPNQLYINKQFAMTMLYLMSTAYGKVAYDRNRIDDWSNQIGAAIKVNGDVSGAVQQLQPGQMNPMVIGLIDKAIDLTKELAGASDAALGDVNPTNTSAIIAVQQSSAVPLEGVKQNLFQFVEDQGLIWLDFMLNKYIVPRKISYKESGKIKIGEFDGSKLKNIPFNIKIDVGPSSYWSEITSMQTLDNLLKVDKITFLQYLERIPNGMIPKKQELIEELKAQAEMQQGMDEQSQMLQQQQNEIRYEQMAKFIESLPEEVQAELKAMPDEQMEQTVMQMMQQQ